MFCLLPRDPCEREARDVFVSLTPQEREDITALAQDYVRKIHFRFDFNVGWLVGWLIGWLVD